MQLVRSLVSAAPNFIERVIGPILEEVPAPQRALWEELNSLPAHP